MNTPVRPDLAQISAHVSGVLDEGGGSLGSGSAAVRAWLSALIIESASSG